jgi:hypothetical protein
MPPVKRGHENGKWKGGVTVNANGYLQIMAGPLRGQYVHRIVLEAKLGRPLREDEEAHHINGDTLDCRQENLEAVPLQDHRPLAPGQPWRKK